MKETLQAIPFAPGYYASADGDVFSELSYGNGRTGTRWRKLKPGKAPRSDYLRISLQIAGREVRTTLHQVICRTFHGERPSADHQVRHLNGDRFDCRAANLAWGTAAENIADRDRHGTTMRGERHCNAKLSSAQVEEIRRSEETQRSLARKFGVSQYAIWSVRNALTWATSQESTSCKK